jgi:hypothetical protein
LTNVNVEIGIVDVEAVGGLLEVLRNVRSFDSIAKAIVVCAYNVGNAVVTNVVVLNQTESGTRGLGLDELSGSVNVVGSLGEGRSLGA